MTERTPAIDSGANLSATGRRLGIILAVLCLCQFMVILDITIVNVSLEKVREDLGLSASDLSYVVTTYGTLLGGFLMLGGRCADFFGRKRMLIIGMSLFAVASLTAALAQQGWHLFISRGFQGLGAAFLTTAALSTLTSVFEEGPARNRALGIWGALAGGGSAIGVMLGGLLTDGPGWRWIFWLNVPVGLVAIVLVIRVVPSIAAPRVSRLDLPGAVTLTAGLLLVVAGISRSDVVGWVSASTFGAIFGGLALIGAFVAIELNTTEPLIDLRIFRRRMLRGANLVGVLTFGALAGYFFSASLLMQRVFGFSPLKTGFAYVPLAVAVVVGAGVASRMVASINPRNILLVGLPLAAAGFVLVAAAPNDPNYWQHLFGPFLLVGLALGSSFVPIQILAFGGTTREESGLAAGLINTSQEVGGAVGVAVLSTVAVSRTNHVMTGIAGAPTIDAIHSGYRYALLANAGLVFAAFVVALVLLGGRVPAIDEADAELPEPVAV